MFSTFLRSNNASKQNPMLSTPQTATARKRETKKYIKYIYISTHHSVHVCMYLARKPSQENIYI